MKRLFTLLAIVALLPAISFAQVKKADAPIRQGYDSGFTPLYGDVESITIREYKLEERFDEVVKGEMEDCDKYTFNQRGDVVEYAVYDSYGRKGKDLYKYDSAGNMIEEEVLSYSFFFGESYERRTYRYDSAGNQIEKVWYNSSGELDWRLTYRYDSAGNLIELVRYDSSGELMWRYTYEIEYR